MQHVELFLDHEDFYCPVTGQHIRSHTHYEPSPAMVFEFVDEVGEVFCHSEELQKVLDELEEHEDDFPDDILRRFMNAIDDDSIICFTITTRHMACGPVASTVRFGINMNFEKDSTVPES